MLNSGAHWVTIFGMEKQGDDQVSWMVMDPMRNEIQRYSTETLSERLLGSALQGTGAGAEGELFIVDVPRPHFQVRAVRQVGE